MAAIFSKNCILMGEIDLYCLACCAYMTSEDDALSHIQGSNHKDVIKFLGYFEKHEEDFIRKVNGIYLCEVCNVTLSTATKVKSHVAEEAHRSGRCHVMKRSTGGVRCGRVAVAHDAWHGLVAHTCVLCGVDNCDVSHTQHRGHLLNLIHSRVIFGPNDDVYRKVGDVYQCLTCNKVISEQMLTEHLVSEDHKKSLKYDKDPNDGRIPSNEDHVLKDETNAVTQEESKEDIKPQKYEESASKPRELEENEINVSASLTKAKEIMARNHGLIIKDSDNMYCKACSTQVPATFNDLIHHVTNRKHIDNKAHCEESPKEMPKVIEKVKMTKYVSLIQSVKTRLSKYLIINNSLCIHFRSLVGLNAFQNKIICEFCYIDLVPENISSHLKSKTHLDFFMNCFVITSLENEFVRQIKSDMYHCGYCGGTESDYDDMLDHLATTEHKSRKRQLQNMLLDFLLQLSDRRWGKDVIFSKLDFSSLHNIDFFNEVPF